MRLGYRILTFTAALFLSVSLHAAFIISGHIKNAAHCFYPRVYLAAIDNISGLNGISSREIIASADMDSIGNFTLKGNFLADDTRLYRLYLTRAADEKAYISIGLNENYVLLLLNNQSEVNITCNNICAGMPVFSVTGSVESRSIVAAHTIATAYLPEMYAESAEDAKKELLQKRTIANLKAFADSCAQPLAALFALLYFDTEKDYTENKAYYQRFLARLKKELPQSTYTKQFEQLLREFELKNSPPEKTSPALLIVLSLVLALSIGMNIYLLLKNMKNNRVAVTDTVDVSAALTIKEKQILFMMDEGLSNKEIADKLNIELSTVKSHVSRIYQKAQIKNRNQVAEVARKLR